MAEQFAALLSMLDPLESQPTKTEIRQSLLKTRRAISEEEWRHKSDHICYHLQSYTLFTSAQTILAYFSFRQEPDLSSLFVDSSHRWGFARCVGNALSWHVWKLGDTLQKGSYGILEPPSTALRLDPTEVDLILVPAVACDQRGYRLGYGGGFYDRMLSSAEWASKPTIGIVFEFAYLPQLPVDGWDRPLQAVCTETRLIKIKP